MSYIYAGWSQTTFAARPSNPGPASGGLFPWWQKHKLLYSAFSCARLCVSGLSLTGRSLSRLNSSIAFEALPLSSTKAPESPATDIMGLNNSGIYSLAYIALFTLCVSSLFKIHFACAQIIKAKFYYLIR